MKIWINIADIGLNMENVIKNIEIGWKKTAVNLVKVIRDYSLSVKEKNKQKDC